MCCCWNFRVLVVFLEHPFVFSVSLLADALPPQHLCRGSGQKQVAEASCSCLFKLLFSKKKMDLIWFARNLLALFR